tara:strand:+ start:1107 stop:1688 length:582 start_codon:yes stop_codon:yes gene_type:complete
LSYDPNNFPLNRSRKRKLEMSDDWIINFLNETKVGHISTQDLNQPFINPTSFFYDSNNHEIFFHSNAYGRMRFNAEKSPKVCFECFKSGRLLPSNLALEMSFQYECVMVFGKLRIVDSLQEKREVLNGLLKKYFNEMESGKDYRPITDGELKQTSVYGINIDSWSGKKNWEEKAEQAEEGEWPDLDQKWFEIY